MLGPTGAAALLRVHGRQDGMYEITFAMKDGTRQMVLEYEERPMASGKSLLQQTWGLLDAEMDIICAASMNQDVSQQKQRARAVADVLALFMKPHFNTADEIAREAKRRWQARRDGNTEYETVGLGYRATEFPSKYTTGNVPGTAPTKKTAAPARSKPAVQVPDEAKPGIKQALAMGMMTATELAKSYKTTVAVIEQIARD